MPRKRKKGPRERNGRPSRSEARKRPQRDHGTPELQYKRAVLAQGADPTKTSHPLDLLHARGLISDDQHQAGMRYAWLHALAFGKPQNDLCLRYGRLIGEAPGQIEREPQWLAERRVELRNADRQLNRYTRQSVYDIVVLCQSVETLTQVGYVWLSGGLITLVQAFGQHAKAA